MLVLLGLKKSESRAWKKRVRREKKRVRVKRQIRQGERLQWETSEI